MCRFLNLSKLIDISKIYKLGSFSSIGIKENVIQIEVFSNTKVVIIRDGKIPLLINSESLDFPQVDAVLLKSYLEYSAIQLIGLSDGSFKHKTYIKEYGGGACASKEGKNNSSDTSTKNTNDITSSIPVTLSPKERHDLHYFCLGEDLQILKIEKFLRKHIYTKDSFIYAGESCLTSPCLYKRMDIIKFLVEKGADINTPLDEYSSAIHFASGQLIGDYNELLDYLLSLHVNVDVKSGSGITPLCYASKAGKSYVVLRLAPIVNNIDEVCNNDTLLAIAAEQNHLEVVKILIDHHADPKKIRPAVIAKLSNEMKRLIFSSDLADIANKIAKKVSRDLKIEQSFTDEQTSKYQPLIVKALKKTNIIASISDEANPQTTIDRNNLAEEIKKEIIRYSKSNVPLNNGEIEEGLTDKIAIWKSQNQLINRTVVNKADSTMPSVSRSSLFSPPQATAQSSSQPVIIERYHQPPKKDFVEDMRQNMNSIAQVENATANLVNAFSNTFGNNSG